jgi:hypothetical protein
MANWVFTVAGGSFIRYMQLPLGGTDALLVVLLQSTGLQADATLQDYTTLQAILTAGNLEATFTNYARIVVNSGITITPNLTANTQTVTMGNWTWNSAGGAVENTLGKLLVCYRATSATLDSSVIPLTGHDFTATTTGTNLLASIATTGLAVATTPV